MATVEYMHLCDDAFSGEDGKHCIIGIFDAISATTFPVTYPMITVALRVVGLGQQPLRIRIEIGLPRGDVVAATEGMIEPDVKRTAHVNVKFLTATFPEPGQVHGPRQVRGGRADESISSG